MYWELAVPLAEHRIMEAKLRFYHHLVNLGQDSIAHKIHMEQRRLNLPSITKECRELLILLNINEVLLKKTTKQQWKQQLKTKIKEKTQADLLAQMKRYKKFDYFMKKDEEFKIKDYFETMKLEDCRIMFSIKSETVRTVKTHYFSDKVFASELWKCPTCTEAGSLDSITHIKNCDSYKKLREKYDLEESDTDLVCYFKEVLRLRNAAQNE